jgi:hypothetical protein
LLPLIVSLALLLGAGAAGAWARMAFAQAHPTFRCTVRWPDDRHWETAPRWQRHRVRAAWVHDVLLVQRGVLRPRTVVLAVRRPDRPIRPVGPGEVPGLRRDRVVLSLLLDDGQVVDLAARQRDLTALAGPFLVAAITALPPAETEPHRYGS